jgi:hypothetical protein
MHSFISRFSALVPRRVVGMLVAGLAGYLACVWYTSKVNPQTKLGLESSRIKTTWSARMGATGKPKYVFFGGSSCGFSIDAASLWRKHGLPAVNLGLSADMGTTVLTKYAFDHVRAGDTLVMALEPRLLEEIGEPPMFGIQFSTLSHRLDWLDPVGGGPPFSRLEAFLNLRPGGYNLMTMLGKVAARRPLYRYTIQDFDEAGWTRTQVRRPLAGAMLPPNALTHEVRRYLLALQEWCRDHHVRLVYSLPWGYVPTDQAPSFRKASAGFLLCILEFMPALKDPSLGARSNPGEFADTPIHLTEESARVRTELIAQQLASNAVWTADELSQLARSH